MKIVKARDRINKAILGAALTLAIMPIIGLLTGTAFSMGLYGINYEEVSLQNNPEQYWFVIKLETSVVLFIVFRAKFTFPLFDSIYQALLTFRDKYKLIAYLLLYLATPILVVALCFFLMSFFNL
ncbi:hypothetical protein [Shewanella frigidimarina]|uniref:hypothetical protein n=1 Tax=Shewanella frigidimarina TaxID=56812 RepID=UPI003D7A84BB